MTDRFDRAFDFMIQNEGGYVNHPNDPGGATNYGVSLRTLKALGDEDFDLDEDGDIDADDIRAMSLADAKAFYHRYFWDNVRYTDRNGRECYVYESMYDEEVAIKIFDMSVNMGHKQAVKIVQRTINLDISSVYHLSADGVIGEKTMTLLQQEDDTETFLRRLQSEFARFYYQLADKKPARAVFLLGWLRRAYK